jgi:hypothetical protein
VGSVIPRSTTSIVFVTKVGKIVDLSPSIRQASTPTIVDHDVPESVSEIRQLPVVTTCALVTDGSVTESSKWLMSSGLARERSL